MTRALQETSQDSLRATLTSVFTDPKYVWERPHDPWARLRAFLGDLVRWFEALHDEHVVVYWLLVAAMTLVLAAIVAHAGTLAYRALRARPSASRRPEALVAPVRDAGWYLREADRLETEGRLLESLACRFAALLHRLEARRAVKVHPSKTPLEYSREAALDTDSRSAFVGLVRDYYRYSFGGATLDRAGLTAFSERAATLMNHGAAT